MRSFLLFYFIILCLSVLSQEKTGVNIIISASEQYSGKFSLPGRLVIYFSKKDNPAPVFQGAFSGGRIAFGATLKNGGADQPGQFNLSKLFSSDEDGLKKISEGAWFAQAIYNISGKPGNTGSGNLVSKPVPVNIALNSNISIELSDTVKMRGNRLPVETEYVKYVELESRLLSSFWKKPMKIRASVLLPGNYKKESGQKYPVRISIGGYGSSWIRASRLEQDKRFMDWWLSDEAPAIITVFPDGDGPLGDPYYIDSDNSGPYGSALTQELIPFIEKEFRGIGKPEYRFVDGCSTGGWVSFALQVFYPGYFNGAWSFSADPVDFHHLQLVNIYDKDNAFYNEFGYLTPSMRTRTGQPRLSIKDEVAGENIQSFDNTYATGGDQWGAWNALYSPKGSNGLPMEVFHPLTGAIDRKVAENWKKYDLLEILRNNWTVLGPQLQGKLWIWMGDLDEYYLNNAMHEMEKFLKSTQNPVSDAVITFDPRAGHCDGYDHRKVLEMMKERIEKLKSDR